MRNIFFNFVKLLQGIFPAEVDGIFTSIEDKHLKSFLTQRVSKPPSQLNHTLQEAKR